MGTYMCSAPAESPPRKRISRRRVRLGAQDGQSLIIVVLSMFVVLGISAVAIDLAQWYQKHHQAQVAADAAALATANCFGRGDCTSTSAGTSTAMTYANSNGVPASTVAIDTTNYNVTVTTQTAAPTAFAALFGLKPNVAARAVANWNSGSTPYSFFAGNTSCASGTGLYFADNGGGLSNVPGVHSNGSLTVNNNSGSVSITGSISDTSSGSACLSAGTKNVSVATLTTALAWPETYSPPTCTTSNTATYWTTAAVTGHQIVSGGGVYCVTTPFPTTATCGPGSGTTNAGIFTGYSGGAQAPGSIYLGSQVTGVELYAPCVVISSGASGSSAITGSTPFQYPLVYGSGLNNPTVGHGQGSNASSANPTVFIGDTSNGGGITLTGAIYAPGSCTTDPNFPVDSPNCSGTINGGTVEISGNNQLTGFVEAENIWIDKNNFHDVVGNGPTNTFGGTALTQ
jgi:hypothetical protein